jgi:hypothetical protein
MMNTGRVVGGILCLAAAALITVLTFVLPENSMMFTVGDANMPLLPAIVLGIVGVVLLVTGVSQPQPAAKEAQFEDIQTDPEKVKLNKRLETMGWGLFLIMIGGLALVPDSMVPQGVWSIGVGLIMLGLNAARYYYGIRMSGFTTVLGVLALASGVAELLGFNSLGGAFLLIILGAYLILKPWVEERQLFGKVASD